MHSLGIFASTRYARLWRCPVSWKMANSLISVWKWFYILCLYDNVILYVNLLDPLYICSYISRLFTIALWYGVIVFTVLFLFTFFCIFSSTSMLEIKTIYTPKELMCLKSFFSNLFQLQNQIINKHSAAKKKYPFNIPIV